MTPRYTEGYTEGFSDGLKDKPVVPTREVKHLFYMVGAFALVVAAVDHRTVTIVVAMVLWIAGVGWWFYPLARAKFTQPIKVVKEPTAKNTPPPVTDQRVEAMNAPLTPEEEEQLFAKPVNPRDDDETRRLKVVMTDPEEESA